MQITINSFLNNSIGNKKNVYANSNLSFKASANSRTLKQASMALIAGILLSGSCMRNNLKFNNQGDSVEFNINRTGDEDNLLITATECKNDIVSKRYYYYPKDSAVSAENYNWSEKIYSDGKIERDSAGYNISITPNGERTVIKTDTDEFGHKITTIQLPNGTKSVRTDYKMDNPKEILYTINIYKNANLISSIYYNEYPTDSSQNNMIEKSFHKYSDDGVLLYWYSNVSDSARNEKFNKYDKYGRLLYDDLKDETYYYIGKQKAPSYSVSLYDDCKRVTIYNPDSSVKEKYFQASDGTITQYTDMMMCNKSENDNF